MFSGDYDVDHDSLCFDLGERVSAFTCGKRRRQGKSESTCRLTPVLVLLVGEYAFTPHITESVIVYAGFGDQIIMQRSLPVVRELHARPLWTQLGQQLGTFQEDGMCGAEKAFFVCTLTLTFPLSTVFW